MEKKNQIVGVAVELGETLLKDIIMKNNVISTFNESDDEIEDGTVILTTMLLGIVKEAPPRINKYVQNIVANYNQVEFQQNFRMSRESFEKLLHHFYLNIHLVQGAENFKISPEKQLLAAIWILATPESFRSIGERFDMAKSTLSKVFFRIIEFLNQVAANFIKFPNINKKAETKNYFQAHKRLNGIVGVVDGTYVPCKVPKEQRRAYTNRKLFTAVTLQAICDHKMRYIDCFIGYPSSVNDNRIFINSDIYKSVQQNKANYFDDDEKILGDKAYQIESWCIPPFIDRGDLTGVQRRFNKIHSSCR